MVGVEGGHSGGPEVVISGVRRSLTVLMRSGSDYRSLSLVHGRKSVISKFDPLKKNFRGEMGDGSGGHQIRTRGVYTPSKEEFSRSTPKDLRPI